MEKRTTALITLGTLLILPIIVILVARIYLPSSYIYSSIYKLLFLFPVLYGVYIYKKSLKDSLFGDFKFQVFKKKFLLMIGIGLLLALVYLSTFLIFKNFIDIGLITNSLDSLASINAKNIIFIGIFIIFFNSVLEEYFWRGFIFKETRKLLNPWTAHIITGLAFSLHHIIFYLSWFSVPFLVLATLGLTGYSIVMNFVFQKNKDLFSCWLIHGIVDVVQILIAMSILGII